MDHSPFLGVYETGGGQFVDMFSGQTVSPEQIEPEMTPFYGVFLDKDGNSHDLAELTAGGGSGGGDGDLNYTHVQSAPSDTWTITHNLGKRPSVTVITSSGDMVLAVPDYINANTLVLRFSSGFSGKAYLN